MSTKYAPKNVNFWSGLFGFGALPQHILDTTSTINQYAGSTGYFTLASSQFGTFGVISEKFNPQDRPNILRAAVFVNFADGMPIPRFVSGKFPGSSDYPFMSLVCTNPANTGDITQLMEMPIPAFNTWFDVNAMIGVPLVSTPYYVLTASLSKVSFYTKSIDPVYNGSGITFTLAVQTEQTFVAYT